MELLKVTIWNGEQKKLDNWFSFIYMLLPFNVYLIHRYWVKIQNQKNMFIREKTRKFSNKTPSIKAKLSPPKGRPRDTPINNCPPRGTLIGNIILNCVSDKIFLHVEYNLRSIKTPLNRQKVLWRVTRIVCICVLPDT